MNIELVGRICKNPAWLGQRKKVRLPARDQRPSSESLQHLGIVAGHGLSAHVLVHGDRRAGVAELIGNVAGTAAAGIEEAGAGLAENAAVMLGMAGLVVCSPIRSTTASWSRQSRPRPAWSAARAA